MWEIYDDDYPKCIQGRICLFVWNKEKLFWASLNQSLSEVERVSIECRKTKTKVITLANKKRTETIQ